MSGVQGWHLRKTTRLETVCWSLLFSRRRLKSCSLLFVHKVTGICLCVIRLLTRHKRKYVIIENFWECALAQFPYRISRTDNVQSHKDNPGVWRRHRQCHCSLKRRDALRQSDHFTCCLLRAWLCTFQCIHHQCPIAEVTERDSQSDAILVSELQTKMKFHMYPVH